LPAGAVMHTGEKGSQVLLNIYVNTADGIQVIDNR